MRNVAAFLLGCAGVITAAQAQEPLWSMQELRVPAVPDAGAGWARAPLDRFVSERLAAAGLQPSPEASRRQWLVRAALDLTGLPPSHDEVEAFVADARADAFERAADALLQSPRFGERWAQMWLDQVRYADSQGYEKDALRPHMWHYRDWVIAAFNADMPLDRFTTEQLAGDLLPDATVSQRIATAMHRNTMTNTEGGTDDEEFRVAAVIDRANLTASVWLGLTMQCAQCHDHKYDPISQREYFQWYAFFDQTEDNDQPDDQPAIRLQDDAQRARELALRAERFALQAVLATPAGGKVAREAAARLDREIAKQRGDRLPVLCELPDGRRRTTRVLLRGNYRNPGDPVEPGVLACLPPLPDGAPRNRLGLARWLMADDNPLTARVLANRFWQELFGRGVVRTDQDFGRQGEAPTHAELIDHLAVQLRDGGWSLKRWLRMVVLSATYRQSPNCDDTRLANDPDCALLSRMPSLRLPAETLRDRALHVAGLLDARIGGPSVMPPQPDGIWQQIYSGEKWREAKGADRHRRGLYTFWRRSSPHPAMTTFDAPSREFCVTARPRTNTPLQALVTWNDPQFVECAQGLARRVVARGGEVGDGAAWLLAHCLCRPGEPDEIERLRELHAEAASRFTADRAAAALLTRPLDGSEPPAATDPVPLAAWTVVANVVLNLDEFLCKN